MSEPTLPATILNIIVSQVSLRPDQRKQLIMEYLPLIISNTAGYLNDPMVFAFFKHVFYNEWKLALPDIPPPSLEGVFNYDTLVNKLSEHLLGEYREKLLEALRLHGLRAVPEISVATHSVIAEILYKTFVEVLKFVGVIPG